mmetsp:Transcript_12290/g.18855  ORF Transcript_12290/g.18855 Transcript_12290/m.18855 type:complete len:265 (+) Transcript_12290:95-889(+)
MDNEREEKNEWVHVTNPSTKEEFLKTDDATPSPAPPTPKDERDAKQCILKEEENIEEKRKGGADDTTKAAQQGESFSCKKVCLLIILILFGLFFWDQDVRFRACTLMGCSSSLVLTKRPFEKDPGDVEYKYKLCFDYLCIRGPRIEGRLDAISFSSDASTSFNIPADYDYSKHSWVYLKVTTLEETKVLYQTSTKASFECERPNGPGCDPLCCYMGPEVRNKKDDIEKPNVQNLDELPAMLEAEEMEGEEILIKEKEPSPTFEL